LQAWMNGALSRLRAIIARAIPLGQPAAGRRS